MNNTIHESIRHNADILKDLSLKIHANPELGLEEKKACKWQIKVLRKLGFRIEHPFCGMDTAYKAVKGKGTPAVAFLAEYDALPEIGHACGHNLIAAASIAAAEAFAGALKEDGLDGSAIVFGTPAEEGKGGKIRMTAANAFKGADLVLMAHPAPYTSEWGGFLAIRRFNVEFFGKASHAAAAPDQGLNALDATMFLFHGVNAMRQHVKDSSRIHGIVTGGGAAPNIVPDYSSSCFYLRAPNEKYLRTIVAKFKDIAKGAALMAGVKYKLTEGEESYKAGLVVEALNREYTKIATELELDRIIPKSGEIGSSDFGNVSQAAPGLHCYFSICDKECPLHSRQFQTEAGSQRAMASMLKAAEAIANIGLKFVADKSFRREVQSEFRKNLENFS